MFLQSLLRTNPDFADTAIELHQAGRIPSNSYVLDLDAIAANAEHIIAAARRYRLSVFPMTKQFGRNPEALKVISKAGIERYVAVDMACARGVTNAGFEIGHLGHLVQIPRHETEEAIAMAPAYWTVFSREQAEAVSRRLPSGRRQKILLRVYGRDDVVVPTHAGGFALEALDADIDHVAGLPGLILAGVTTYPSAGFDRLSRKVVPTPNVRSMQSAAEKLRKHGVNDVQINMASELSAATIPLAAEGGATQIEPGHAFTGTSPYQIFADVPERQAMLYLSEVSHTSGGGAFFFGGGLYECIGAVEHTRQALVGRCGPHGPRFDTTLLTTPPNGVIDFYGRLDYPAGTDVKTGDTVVVCTRPQAFFTRAFIVPIRGIASGSPEVLGVWDVNGFLAAGAPAHMQN
ncbi:alanine racemase [Mesorhizobium sp. WSM3224]|uniref:alanine racemase n=1 Tax=Mesorhizobium sp. WSM3224 TaxID=1040986 RepID=UPI000410373C|nr:alanine racemase [Mesorhizobium sp. WSM3224]